MEIKVKFEDAKHLKGFPDENLEFIKVTASIYLPVEEDRSLKKELRFGEFFMGEPLTKD